MKRSGYTLLVLLGMLGCAEDRDPGQTTPPYDARQIWVKGERVLSSQDPLRNCNPLPTPWNESIPASLHWIEPMWCGETAWSFGYPSSPALDRVLANSRHFRIGWDLSRVSSGNGRRLWGTLPWSLYRKGPGESWRKVGHYHPSLDPHGSIAALEPLGDGRFLAFARFAPWFTDQGLASPCARYALDVNGELRFQNLVPLLKDTPLPQEMPASQSETPWTEWRLALPWAISPKGILVGSNKGHLALLDAQSGHLTNSFHLPQLEGKPRYEGLELLPGPDGSFVIVAAKPEGSGKNERGYDAMLPRPAGILAAARLGMQSKTVPLHLVAFRLDPLSGDLNPLPLPRGLSPHLPGGSRELYNLKATRAFLVGDKGQLELHWRRLL
jgi:hypothetical protein